MFMVFVGKWALVEYVGLMDKLAQSSSLSSDKYTASEREAILRKLMSIDVAHIHRYHHLLGLKNC